jgi:small subunit ribosomal protein S21
MSRDISKKSKNNFKKAPKGGESISQDSKVGDAILAQPLEVRVYNNNFDKALRAFRALVQKERILSAYKEKQSYEKPSQKRRRKRNEMKRKLLELNGEKQKRNSGGSGESFVE